MASFALIYCHSNKTYIRDIEVLCYLDRRCRVVCRKHITDDDDDLHTFITVADVVKYLEEKVNA